MVAIIGNLPLVAQLESGSAGIGAGSPASKAHSLSPHHILSFSKYYGLCDTKYSRNTFTVIQIKDSSGLFVFCSECSVIMKFISPVTSESFLSYTRA